MNPLGTTRTAVKSDHALLAPDSHVPAPLPDWGACPTITLISPRMGARFHQYLVTLEAAVVTLAAHPTRERFLYMLDGEMTVEGLPSEAARRALTQGGYVYLPPCTDCTLHAPSTARLLVWERDYVPLDGSDMPAAVVGHAPDVEAVPFLGDPDARLQTLLPTVPAFDMAVNLFTFQPGAALPFVEAHVMEHGLLLLDGAGIYRLSDCWYPVQAGDAIWMAPYCPQWFAALGKAPARYLYYKDIHRDPLASGNAL